MINDSDTDTHSLLHYTFFLGPHFTIRWMKVYLTSYTMFTWYAPNRTPTYLCTDYGASDCWVASGDLINRRAGNKILIFHEIGEERPLRKYKIWFSKFKMFWVIFLYFSGGEKPWLEQFLWTIYNQRFSLSLLCSINPLERRVGRGRMRDERADGWSPFYKISGGSD